MRIQADSSDWARLGRQTTALLGKMDPSKRRMLQRMRAQVEWSIVQVYMNVVTVPGHQHPTHYQGRFINGVRVWPSPRADWLQVEIYTDYALGVEFGFPPSSELVDYQTIADWAQDKLGVDNARIVNNIVRNIQMAGTRPHRVVTYALDPSNNSGRHLHEQIRNIIATELQMLYNSAGWAGR